ncbi:Rhodanese domain protein [Emericellopsis atlantica]|uniref:Rhodanese domain protein n=1 Tax=Emericellopsis atlantica TaxID=2614577 RepID=A0A9P8CRU8_9HYPO|nr:Rhodanese domain protein [Emericellopsis atlantica]KAG9256500.1 Rhodanese domain protein [Emericellopsis atlantica]
MAAPRRALTGMLFRAAVNGRTATTALRTASRASSHIVSSPSPLRPAHGPHVSGLRWYSINKPIAPESKIYKYDDVVEAMETKKTKDGRPSYLIGTSTHHEVQNAQLVRHGILTEGCAADVREPAELQSTGRIPGAINIPITTAVQSFHISNEDFEDMYGFERPPKDAHLVFYCKAGVRAKSAAGLAVHAGWESVGEYPGSWLDWEKNNGKVEPVRGNN